MVTEHDVETCEDDHEERWTLRQRLRDRYRRARWSIAAARQTWRDGNATVVGAVVMAHPGMLDDEPRVRALIDTDLRAKMEAVRPLGWRKADALWALRNLRRALRGEEMLPVPYEVVVEVEADRYSALDRNLTAIRATQRRRPRRDL